MKIVTYGMGREKVMALVRSHLGAGDTVEGVSDYQAATELKSGKADFAIGVCQSGAGGALAIAKALVGADLCGQLSTPSRKPTGDEIAASVAEGKRCFGIALPHVETVVPDLVEALVVRQSKNTTPA